MSRLARTEEILIKGATLVDASGDRRADVRVSGGVIVEVGPELEVARSSRLLDASGSYLVPAFVDLHTHLREPGGERAETILTGSRAGALGGYRCLVAMPNTSPAIDSVEAVEHVRELAAGALCEIVVSAAITLGRLGEWLAPIAELAHCGVHLFTDDGRGVQSEELMREALVIAKGLDVVLAQHCEIEQIARGGVMHEGRWSSRLGLNGQPSSAEDQMVARDLALVRELDASIHFLHLSTEGSVELVRRAKAEGLSVSAEATPHHLALTHDEVVSFDPVFRVNPPLRTLDDVEAVRRAVLDGTIDAVATDHAPHPPEEKDETFDCAPPGMIGLETAFAVVHSELVARCHLRTEDDSDLGVATMSDLVRLFSTNPSRIAGVAPAAPGRAFDLGARADLVVFDPTERWSAKVGSGASRSRNTPFAGLDLVGRVRHTVFGGETVVIDAQAQR